MSMMTMTSKSRNINLPTAREVAIREALYQGRHSATEDKCGAEPSYRARRAKWDAIATKADWTMAIREEGWNAYCVSYANAMANGEKESLVEAVALWNKVAGL